MKRQHKEHTSAKKQQSLAALPEELSYLADEAGSISTERISQTLQNNYMPYAMSVIISRAIPEIDGFKPAHRKLLYTMYKSGLLTGPRSKSANVVGATMKLNPHGDQAIYDTLVRLTRGNESLLHPYIDSKGNMGKQYSKDMQSAAPRYTEVKLDPIAALLFRGIDEDMVDFVPNYDGTMQEPTLLPAAFPSVLVNANQGIAVGMASNICSFNLKEVCEATIAYIDDPTCDLLTYMPAPDFASGANLIYDQAKMREIYNSGRGSFKLRATYTINKAENCIEIRKIPYTSTIEGIIDKLAELVKTNKIKEIVDVRDETDINGLCITIDYKKSADPEQLMQKLFSLSELENTFPCNFNLLINSRPVVLGIRGIISEWLVFRRNCVKRSLLYKEAKLKDKLHLLAALAEVLLDVDKAIKIIKNTELDSEVVPNLAAAFKIDQAQAEYVAEIKLRQLNKEHLLKRLAEKDKLQAELADIAATLASTTKLDHLIAQELKEIAKTYGKERKTKLISADSVVTVKESDFIADFNLKAFLTRDGYLKKIALTSLRSTAELKLKDNDAIIGMMEGSNKQEVLLFSSLGNLYKLKLADLNDDKPSDWGTYLPNLLDLASDEKIVGLVITSDYQGEIAVAYADGRVSRADLSNYETKQNRKKLVKAVSSHSPVVAVYYLTDEMLNDPATSDFIMISDQQRAILFNINLVNKKTTRSNRGDQVLKLKKQAKVISFLPLSSMSDPSEWQRHRSLKLATTGITLKSADLGERQVTLFK
ncbi:DNA topoisomerase (ATP-hydrolyzing) subunit A [Amygdalobacter nucleatus]|nr:DNA topoisomerase (ATP-hydrolyzing) subunit A [Amygdalobacter nucleatus]WEG37305.1 DNA topoisomerase (ATP-hydrolyzing) subunit A [Amygdalobacter nucleatus]